MQPPSIGLASNVGEGMTATPLCLNDRLPLGANKSTIDNSTAIDGA